MKIFVNMNKINERNENKCLPRRSLHHNRFAVAERIVVVVARIASADIGFAY